MQVYRFHCWEQNDRSYQPSLIGYCNRSGRLAYFESHCDLTFDITSMAATSYVADEQPLICIALASQPPRISLYVPLHDLADAIAGQQDDVLWRMLRMTTRNLPSEHRLA